MKEYADDSHLAILSI